MRTIVARSRTTDDGDPTATAPDSGQRQRARTSLGKALAVGLTTAALGATPALADDIDVYTARIANQKKPNILFVLDYSGSMRRDINNDDTNDSDSRKINILRDAMDTVLYANRDYMRAGIGSIYGAEASGVRWPVSDLNADAHDIDSAIPAGKFTARDIMLKQLYRRDASGNTRTVNALVEAAMYFRGGAVANGGLDTDRPPYHEPDTWNTSNDRYEGGQQDAAVAASYTPTNAYWRDVFEAGNFDYCTDNSPRGGINECAGKTTYDCIASGESKSGKKGEGSTNDANKLCKYEHPDEWRGANYNSPIGGSCEANAIVLISDGLPDLYRETDALKDMVGGDYGNCEDLSSTIFNGVSDDWNGNCGPEVVRQLADNPQVAGIPESTVKTYTVGFGIDGVGKRYLDRLAAEGGTKESYSAGSPAQLNTALQAIIEDAIEGNESFADISVNVDKATFSHENRAFVSLFEPSTRRGWEGNLKGYFLGTDGLVDTNNQPALAANGSDFAAGAQSFWSAQADGNDATAGGASALLATTNRKLYFYDDDASVPAAGADLALVDSFRLRKDNSAIDKQMLEVGDDSTRDTLLDWIQTAPMGDPLHSQSVGVSYGSRQVVYVMTNQGLLHAIDATAPTSPTAMDHSGGEEIFAFMPGRLLPNLVPLAGGAIGKDHVYGLDGAITRWHEDDNNDGIVNDGDTVMLVFGMRRGGDAYYAMDVTDPERPILKWKIDSSTSGFSRLAQSWSRMSLVNVNLGGSDEKVLMFGGGYDADKQDDKDAAVDSRGNAIFVIDREGDLVIRFDNSDHSAMQHAFAADLTPIDSNGDGRADRLYAADLGGQVWRIDFDDVSSGSQHRVTRLADLDDGSHQPFFSAPSVALNQGSEGEFLSISVGSGNRTAPLLKTSANKFYMLRDTDVGKGFPASGFATIHAGDLYDASNNQLASRDDGARGAAGAALRAARGWLIQLDAAEKSLSRLVSFEGQLYATTFSPDGSASSDACASPTTSRLYRMDIKTGAPASAKTASGGIVDTSDRRQRRIEIQGDAIPSAPSIVFLKGGTTQVYVNRAPATRIAPTLSRVYWHAK